MASIRTAQTRMPLQFTMEMAAARKPLGVVKGIHAKTEFQARPVERHGHNPHDFEPSFGSCVEANDFLRGMTAQMDAAAIFDRRSITSTADLEITLGARKAIFTEWKGVVLLSDGGEELIIVDGFNDGVSAMVPLLALL